MKSTTKNHVSNFLNLRVLVGIGEKCRTYLLVIFAFLLTALPGWALSVVQESVTIANTEGTELNYMLYSDYTATLLDATSNEISALNIPASVKYEEQEYKVTKIGKQAFAGKTSLTSISGGENITEIGFQAFSGCSALTCSIVFNNVKNIGEGAFEECGNGWLNLTFNNLECETIGPSAFKSFNGTVNLNGNVDCISNNAFYNSNNNVNFQVYANLRGITYLDNEIFHNIKRGKISLEVNIVYIDVNTFYSCNASINISGTIQDIYQGAFKYCSAGIKISGTIQNIYQGAFQYCSAGINISGTIQDIYQVAFDNCNETIIELYNSYQISINNNPYSRGDRPTIYVLQTLVEDYKTKGINANFYALQAKTINGVKYAVKNDAAEFEVIGTADGASFADGIVNIIDNINGFPVTSIGANAFSGCSGLTSIDIPNSVTSIGDWAFNNCIGLTSVTIPNSVTSIGSNAFCGCSGLTSITIPNSVTSIGDNAFWDCRGLNDFIIVNDMFVFMPKTYSGHYSILENISKIIGGAFVSCSGLTSVTIPNSVTSIGVSAFEDCSDLTSVTIPNSVTYISDYTFSGCTGLTSVTIPNSVTSIGVSAFSGCTELKSVTIGSSVTAIAENAFSGCDKIEKIYCYAKKAPSVTNNPFTSSVYNNAKLYIQNSSLENYKQSSSWISFKDLNRFTDCPTGISPAANENSEVYYSTYSNNLFDTELQVEAGKTLTVYDVIVDNGKLELNPRAGAKVASGEGVLVRTDATYVSVVNLKGYDLVPASEEETMLKATPVEDKTITAPSGYKLFRLTYNDSTEKEGLGFYYGNAEGSQVSSKIYKAYLQVPTEELGSSTNASKGFRLGDTTGIDFIEFVPEDDTEEPTYNLKGQQVDKAAKGIVVKRNKKYYSK